MKQILNILWIIPQKRRLLLSTNPCVFSFHCLSSHEWSPLHLLHLHTFHWGFVFRVPWHLLVILQVHSYRLHSMSGVTTSSLSLAWSHRNWVILDYEEANGLTIRPWAPFLLSSYQLLTNIHKELESYQTIWPQGWSLRNWLEER